MSGPVKHGKLFQAMFHLRPILPDNNLENTISAKELAFPGFVPNADQLRIAQKVMKRTEPILNCEGAPGCGKTQTVVAIIRLLIKQSPETKILVCGPSNRSADRIVELLNKMLAESDDIDDSTLQVL